MGSQKCLKKDVNGKVQIQFLLILLVLLLVIHAIIRFCDIASQKYLALDVIGKVCHFYFFLMYILLPLRYDTFLVRVIINESTLFYSLLKMYTYHDANNTRIRVLLSKCNNA